MKEIYRKPKHGNLGEKANKRLNEDECFDVNEYLDKSSIDKYCSSCEFFETEDCPNYGDVNSITEWKKIKCRNFMS